MNIIGIDFSILYPGICISEDFNKFKWIGIANGKISKKDIKRMEDREKANKELIDAMTLADAGNQSRK